MASGTTVGDSHGSDRDRWLDRHSARPGCSTEQYSGGMAADTSHLLMSVSKSLIGMVAGALAGNGALDVEAELTTYVPALGTRLRGRHGAPAARHAIRDRVLRGLPGPDGRGEAARTGHRLGTTHGAGPADDACTTIYSLCARARRTAARSSTASCETDILGWVCEAAGGHAHAGAACRRCCGAGSGRRTTPTIGVDSVGTGMFDGGINACSA